MAPRTGPQNVTMDDLRRVTGRITRLQPGGPRPLPSQQIVSNLVGGPLPTYGKKYGGFPTQEQQVNAIIGQAQVLAQAQALAEEQAAINRANLYGATQFQPRSPADYARLQAEQNRISNVLAQPLTPELSARVSPSVELLPADKAMMSQYQQALTGQPAPAEQPASWFARTLAERKAAEQSKAEAYGRQMERMNAIALAPTTTRQYVAAAGPYAGTVQTVREADLAGAARANLGTPLSGEALRTTVYPAEQTARDLAGTSRAEFAQMLATGRYGMDPGLAAGIFSPEFGAEQRIREASTEFTQPGQSVEDYIALNMGTGALEQYQANKVQEALKKQAEGFRTAEEEAIDLQLEQSTGVNVGVAAGDYALSTARGYLSNQNFVNEINRGVAEVAASKGTSAEDKKNAARVYAQQYLAQTNNPVGAQILLNALLSFDFTLGFVNPSL